MEMIGLRETMENLVLEDMTQQLHGRWWPM